jgi:chromosome segregation ATPase
MDNNSNLSPVTESEVMTFASRICTTIVAHSQQQGTIDHLKEIVEKTTTERDHLRSENAKLNQDIGETTTLADGYSRERDDAMRRVQELEGKLRYQEEMAIQRDAKVAEVQGLLNTLESKHRATASENEILNQTVSSLRGDLDQASRDRDNWQAACNRAHSELGECRTKLDKIPLPIRSHFTGESIEPQTPKPETAKDVAITENAKPSGTAQESSGTEWKPSGPEMKPVQEEHKDDMPF